MTKSIALKRSRLPNYLRRLPVFAAGLLVFVLAQPAPSFYIAGAVLSAAGVLLRLWACGHLEKNKTLTTTGPYAHVQHPLYIGSLLMLCGVTISASAPAPPGLYIAVFLLPFLVLMFFWAYFPRKMRIESERLRGIFGPSYDEYNRQVPSFFPRLTPVRMDDRRWQLKRIFQNSEHLAALAILGMYAYLGLRLYWA